MFIYVVNVWMYGSCPVNNVVLLSSNYEEQIIIVHKSFIIQATLKRVCLSSNYEEKPIGRINSMKNSTTDKTIGLG